MKRERVRVLFLLLAATIAGCSSLPKALPARGVAAVDAAGRPVSDLQTGSTLCVAANGLDPRRVYELRLSLDGQPAATTATAVSFARVSSDAAGSIAPLTLWYHTGVVGCSLRRQGDQLPAGMFHSFEDATRALAGRTATISVHPVAADPGGRTPPMQLAVGEPVQVQRLPLAQRRSPMVYPSDPTGLLCNAIEAGTDDLFVSGRNFEPGQRLLVSVVPNQRRWVAGDDVRDVTGSGGTAAPRVVETDKSGGFTARVWGASTHRRGTYDIVAQIVERGLDLPRRLRRHDFVSYAADTALVLYMLYPVGGPTMDLAGRPISGSPYFQFADSFADQGDTVWGAVDPTYVPTGHPGGRYAAYYVVAHRGVAGWDPGLGGANNLVDVSGGIEIHPVKAGCVNGTDTPIWFGPLTPGQYDVVVDFGPSPAETAAAYTTDFTYDESLDFLDGASQVGFVVAKDPYQLGPHPIGQASYSFDDLFPTLGAATNVDLRAVVRYPAVTAGVNTQVAMGTHPLFLIEHGNHKNCEDAGMPCAPHASCSVRTPNHEGYMHLLEILASHGIVAVSIDAYDLTGCVPGLIPERGDLILKHIEFWSHLHDPVTFPTYSDPLAGRFLGKLDMGKISVSGHSRGGEASVAAFIRNTQGFSINSVSSIAPVDFQTYTLPGVPYFVILPAADGDVSSLSGARIYDRAGSGVGDAGTKSGIHVYGANHNFFNTVWADDNDDSSPARDDYIPAPDQQRIGEAYLAAFTRVHLNGETVYEDMLRGGLHFPSTAGFKIHPFHHETNHLKVESGGNTGTAAGGATTAVASGTNVHSTPNAKVTWTLGTATLEYSGPWNSTGFEVLSFRVAQTTSPLNPATGQDFVVELVGGGKTKAVSASRHGTIPPPYDHPSLPPRIVMTTIRMPLHSFIMNKSGVTLNAIDTIRIKFNNPIQGEIHVDDLEFSR